MIANSMQTAIDPANLKLPPVPLVLVQLVESCHKNDVGFDELKSIIEKDAAITQQVLTIANSAAYAQWNDVRDLNRILIVLGVKTIKSIAITSAVQQFFSKFDRDLSLVVGALWRDSLMCAHAARAFAEMTSYPFPDEAYIAGLLNRIGQLALLHNRAEQYRPLITQQLPLETRLQKEREEFGIDSAALAAFIAASWDDNGALSEAYRYQFHSLQQIRDASHLVKILNYATRVVEEKSLLEAQFEESVIQDLRQATVERVEQDVEQFGIKVTEGQLQSLGVRVDDEKVRLEMAEMVRRLSLLDGPRQDLAATEDIAELCVSVQQNAQLLFAISGVQVFLYQASSQQLCGPDDRCIAVESGRSLLSDALLGSNIVMSFDEAVSTKAITVFDQQLCQALKAEQMACLPLAAKNWYGVIVMGVNAVQAANLEKHNKLMAYFASAVTERFVELEQQQKVQDAKVKAFSAEQELALRKLIHEANNPLGIVRNYLQVLSMKLGDDNESQQHLSVIDGEIARVGDILLRMKNPTENGVKATEMFDLNETVEQHLMLFSSSMLNKNIIISKKLDKNIPLIRLDAGRFKQVLTNLIKNAAESLPEHGEISVNTRDRIILGGKQFVEISIADNGPGLPEQVLSNLFSPVQTTKGGTHAGLGLTIVNNLVTELEGQISYKKSVHGGAEFVILLPRKIATRPRG